ncbi:M20 metallopeptidase family protein [Wenyingzhuangia sp. IMCC45574]
MEYIKELIEFRRELHKYPELGYQEHNTAKLICKELDKYGISYQANQAKTGIVAEISKGKGKCIALRADMDALPIEEQTGLEFSSNNKGVMHACGHDVHSTMLLGAAIELSKKNFNGTIKFIFQPSEEGTNGDLENKSGGQRIVESGVLKNVDYALALHVDPLLEVGKLTYAEGNALAHVGNFKLTVIGKSGHAGAAPHLAVDSILASSALIQNLNTIISRNISPSKAGVLSITMIEGGTAPNIIADKVNITGTIRALETNEYNTILNKVKAIIKGIEIAYGVQIEFLIDTYYPSVKNNLSVHHLIKEVGEDVFNNGLSKVDPLLASEDFAFYSNEVPAMFYFIGAKDTEKEECFYLHHPKMVVNENCIEYGVKFFSKAALKLLNQ